MGCAPSAASNQGPAAEAGEKAGHRPLVSENPGDAARKERRSRAVGSGSVDCV